MCVQFPKKLFYVTDFFPHQSSSQQAVIEAYLQALEQTLDVKRTEISIAQRWSQCPPEESNGKTIREYLDKVTDFSRSGEISLIELLQTAYYPFYYDGYYEYEDFRRDYEKETGKPVYVGPYMQWKWFVNPSDYKQTASHYV